MSLVWKNEYSVGVAEMDNQHRKLVELLNQLDEAMAKGKGKDFAGKVLNELIRYTQTHFTSEEYLMMTHRFPELAAHKVEHLKLTQKVIQFKADYDSGRVSLTIPILNFLEDWLVNHIQGLDKVYGKTIAAKQT